MILTQTIKGGFKPFTDYQEHYLANCQQCGTTIKGTQVNGPAVADSDNNITGAYFLNLWLCRQCYDALEIDNIRSL